ncbi:MAG: CinA family nicotinamide mononucleotide deamidase-related protein [Paludibacteraceae bacterium]|nr:CinA family nicotinamide mononucleotide deamidase-related protein [Paludibacteraceae bacterium]MBN2786767.1 CinA family nicotinamide mononucleotide deamidase-related protein [Paludibacteraceae bacterium]
MKNNPKVEIITIGDEILIGQIVDTNSAWMASQLNKEGFSVFQITSVSDNENHITEAVDAALKRVDIVLLTGGLGPTKDDITKQTLCRYFNTELVFNSSVIDTINRLFPATKNGINELTYSQAYVPKNAIIIQNATGTAPITWFDVQDKVLVSMPGVPSEMEWVMLHEILPRLAKRFNTPSLLHKTVIVEGYAESALAIKISDWENNLPACIKLAYLPAIGIVKLRLTGNLPDKVLLEKTIDIEIEKLRAIIGSSIIATEDIPLELLIGELLKSKKMQLATAESCTGGNIARLITSIPGSSAYFKGSVVAYSNEVKEAVLGVSKELMVERGAVSQPVVEQMAQSVLRLTAADVAVATSGVAGPDGGTPDKPVGTVWICVCTKDKLISRKYNFSTFRDRNITRASLAGLSMIKEILVNC